jgi:hypothetical protein
MVCSPSPIQIQTCICINLVNNTNKNNFIMHMAYFPENMLHLYNNDCWVYISDIIKFIGTTCRFPTKYIYGHFSPLAKHVVVACSNSPS